MIRLIGQTIRETIAVLSPPHMGGGLDAQRIDPADKGKVITRIVVSIALLIVGGYLCTKEDSQSVTAGVGLLTLVAGYWLK